MSLCFSLFSYIRVSSTQLNKNRLERGSSVPAERLVKQLHLSSVCECFHTPSLSLRVLVSTPHWGRSWRKEEWGWRKHRAAGTVWWDKPDQGLGCVTQPVSAAGVPERQKATAKGTCSRTNWIPKSALEFIAGTWQPGVKRMPRVWAF